MGDILTLIRCAMNRLGLLLDKGWVVSGHRQMAMPSCHPMAARASGFAHHQRKESAADIAATPDHMKHLPGDLDQGASLAIRRHSSASWVDLSQDQVA